MANTQNDAHQGSDEPHHPCISPPETPYPNGILFRQVSVIDGEETEGATRLRADVLINDGVISAIHRHEAAETSPEADLCDTDIYGDEEILKVDASGLVLCPHVATSSTSISTTVLRQDKGQVVLLTDILSEMARPSRVLPGMICLGTQKRSHVTVTILTDSTATDQNNLMSRHGGQELRVYLS
ncbi:hypothetical protein PIIN_09271 [Serendipita indica DSM 11827]|uniref:Uncharacterized protein n=1 Tax=Serendipita indica (strain DSM 11827) TaxID=1109443 RepID=G4TVE4_SERID|nr:hypothetical protein PIIN_09271 [Serendipita indica DSM 11827]